MSTCTSTPLHLYIAGAVSSLRDEGYAVVLVTGAPDFVAAPLAR